MTPQNAHNAILDVLADPSTSYWLKLSLEEMMRRDCLDAARDAELLFILLKNRADAFLGASQSTPNLSAPLTHSPDKC